MSGWTPHLVKCVCVTVFAWLFFNAGDRIREGPPLSPADGLVLVVAAGLLPGASDLVVAIVRAVRRG